jgi:hypothetical protein
VAIGTTAWIQRTGRPGVISMMSRQTARTVLPPVFAVALVALVVRPVDEPVVRPAPIPAWGASTTLAGTTTEATPPSQHHPARVTGTQSISLAAARTAR